MDRLLWRLLDRQIDAADRRVRRVLGREKKRRYSNRLIVRMYVWAVWHDRPLCWACERENYHMLFRPRQLPSVSQFCRRVKDDPRFTLTLQYLHEQLAACDTPSLIGCFDGKLIPVALHSADPDAKKVRTNGGYVRGYRLHAWTDRGRIGVWSVTGANQGEQTIARALCQYLPTLSPGTLILGDVRYDSGFLYEQVRLETRARLLTPMQNIARTPRHRREIKPARREAVDLWERHPKVARRLLHQRPQIDRIFGTLSSTRGGLAPLPSWVRRLDRVRRWVGVKIILHNARHRLRQNNKNSL